MKNIGILGGSFDPIHYGHLSIVEAAIEELGFDQILLMPAKVSPFKIGRKMASEEDRLNMVRLVTQNYPKLEVTTIELESEEVSYTYETLRRLQRENPDARLWFILGSDSLLTLEEWYHGDELLSDFDFVLAPRPGYDLEEVEKAAELYVKKYGTEIKVLHNQLVDISSTEIKEAIQQGASIDGFVPKEVTEYIARHNIYR